MAAPKGNKNAEGNDGGRPTMYNEEILAKTKAYLIEWNLGENPDVIPSIEGLAFHLDISRTTIYDWAKQEDKVEFSYTLEKINELQKRILLNKGLSSEFNSNITKLALGNHGMSEKLQAELSGPNGGPIPFSKIERVIVDPE